MSSDIHDVSIIESGTFSYDFRKTKNHEVLLINLVAAGSMVDANEVSIFPNLGQQGKDVEIIAYRDRIDQVFTNIIANAVKYTKKEISKRRHKFTEKTSR